MIIKKDTSGNQKLRQVLSYLVSYSFARSSIELSWIASKFGLLYFSTIISDYFICSWKGLLLSTAATNERGKGLWWQETMRTTSSSPKVAARAQNKPLKLVTAPSERWVRVQFSLNTGRPSSIPSGGDKIFKRGAEKLNQALVFPLRFLITHLSWHHFIQWLKTISMYTSILLVQPLW